MKWLEHFSNDFKQKITPMFEEVNWGPGGYIIKQNELDDSSLYILLDGMVDIKFGELVLCTLNVII